MTDGVNGLLVPERDDEGLANSLLRIGARPGLLENHGRISVQNSRRRIRAAAPSRIAGIRLLRGDGEREGEGRGVGNGGHGEENYYHRDTENTEFRKNIGNCPWKQG